MAASLAAILAGSSFVGCSSSSKKTSTGSAASGSSGPANSAGGLPAGTTVTIGINQSMSGNYAVYGAGEVAGAKYAATVINSQHLLGNGVTLNLDVRDDQTSKGQAAINANAILASNDVAEFGPVVSGNADATTAITGSKMLSVLTEADSTPINASVPYVYDLTPTGASTFPGLAQYLKSKGITSVAFVYDTLGANQLPLAQAGKATFASYGIQTSQMVPVVSTQPQFVTTMNNLAASHVGAVDILLNSIAAVMLRELSAAGYQGALATYSGPVSLIAPAGSAANGLIQPTFFTTLKAVTAEGSSFLDGYPKFNGTTPNSFNAEAYDAIMFIAQAIKMAGSTNRSAIAAAASVLAKRGFTGVQGQYTFNNPSFDNRRANLTSVLLIYGPNAQPATVVTPAA